MKTGKMILGILGGLTVGAILVYYFSPKKIKKTGKKLKKKEAKMVERLSSEVKALKKSAAKKIKDSPNVKKALASTVKAVASKNGKESKEPVA